MTNLIKQTFIQMRRQPLMATLSILGTAIAICLIMVVVMTQEVGVVNTAPESNRYRMLYIPYEHLKGPDDSNSYDKLGSRFVRSALYNLKTPEVVTAYISYTICDASTATEPSAKVDLKLIDAGFFRVFDFHFLEGRPVDPAQCAISGHEAVITESVSRRFFHVSKGVVGRSINLNKIPYKVVGVVSDVSPISKGAYAQIWVPCNLNGTGHLKSGFLPWDSDDMQDGVEVAILARSKADFPAIRREVAQHLSVFNASIVPDTLGLMDEPFEQADYYVRNSSFGGPTLHDIRIRHLIVYIILLLVPAVNLASMTQSRMRQRMSEIGVRRAFGAKRSTILFQVIMESLVQTILAGIIGLFLCFIVCAVWGYLIFAPDTWVTFSAPIYITASMLFHPAVFGWALLFCLILNLLSSGLPAWRASRINIVEALK